MYRVRLPPVETSQLLNGRSVIRLVDNPALITLTFDDGLRSQFQQAVPILDRYGFPATFFLVANSLPIHTDGYAEDRGFRWPKIEWNVDDIRVLKDMAEQGHEIGSHTVNHKMPHLADPVFEAAESKRLIEEWMETEIPSFCYPFYRMPQPLKDAVINAGYKQARGGLLERSYIPRGFSDWFAVDCRQISDNENVGGWVRPGCWHVLTFHGIGGAQDGWQPISVAEFARQMAELAKLRDSGAAEVVTFKDAADRLR